MQLLHELQRVVAIGLQNVLVCGPAHRPVLLCLDLQLALRHGVVVDALLALEHRIGLLDGQIASHLSRLGIGVLLLDRNFLLLKLEHRVLLLLLGLLLLHDRRIGNERALFKGCFNFF